MNGTDSKNPYSYIDDLSMEELESLLRAEALSPEEGDPYLMDYLLEVIVERQKNMPDSNLPDVKKAFEKFNALYRGLKEPLYDSSPLEEETSDANGTQAVRPKTRSKRFPRILLVAAAVVLVIALAIVPVFGYRNVLTMMIHLANGTFRFVPDSSVSGSNENNPIDQSDGTYETLPEALEAYGIYEQVFPQILAEEFEQTELKVDKHELSNSIVIIAYYKDSNQEIKFSVIKHLDMDSWTHEANQENAQIHSINGIEHYIFHNVESTTIIWYRETLECSIKGNLSSEEAEKIIDSIY